MKVLYFGGQKSGKSNLAEVKALSLAKNKPFYIATYDNSYDDKEMHKRVDKHKKSREDNFSTLEEPKDLTKVIKEKETYLVDCISMWIFNNIEKEEQELLKQLEILEQIDCNIVFVLNEVTSGVIPFDKDSRRFVDLTGIIGQKLAKICDEVYEVKFGLESRLK
ncbi:bifunctional adenosylcobinamide kinase/adenosylcobinamide-phosphate guanylyltransferase [Halarcobacter sp.]|uniref:bifunctional adenosylcobinamide kinase/adenosylcobinamide-phosphate guanylyltransferase n=1 Tax=Halarcobacter sp. TaxID=2321133 RepID=UPI0029F55DB3|nr:bifunctional adenosylcobinamide kinase/adenosylcobinamide-phosphate guanylyltransferase [Halarcobacter sp.]